MKNWLQSNTARSQLEPSNYLGKILAISKEWLIRYLPSEIIGTVTALIAASIAYLSTGSLVAAAFAGSIGEAFGFYATAGFREVVHYYNLHHHHAHLKRLWLTGYHTVRGMLIEFGAAEVIDGLTIRPYMLYHLPLLLHNVPLGWLVGKLIADIAFYGIAGVGFELRRRGLKSKLEPRPIATTVKPTASEAQ